MLVQSSLHDAAVLTPLVGPVVRFRIATCELRMLKRGHLKEALVEHLVFVMVDCNVLCVVVGWCEEVVPRVRCRETIVQDYGRIGHIANLTKSIAIKLRRYVSADTFDVKSWLVEKLDADDDVLVLSLRVPLRDGFEYLECLLHSVASLPLRTVQPLSRIIVTILDNVSVFVSTLTLTKTNLGAWRTVEVNDDLQTKTSCPINGCIDVDVCTRNEGRVERVVRPISNWNAHHVEPSLLDLIEVFPSHPCIPVLSENTKRCVLAKSLPERILVDDIFLWPILVRGVKY